MTNTIPYFDYTIDDRKRCVFIREYDGGYSVYMDRGHDGRCDEWTYRFSTDEEAVRKAKYLAGKYGGRAIRRR